jgi:hypothetical protein
MTAASFRAMLAPPSPAVRGRIAHLLAIAVLAATAGLLFVQARAVLGDPLIAAMLTLMLAIPLTGLLRGSAPDRRRS